MAKVKSDYGEDIRIKGEDEYREESISITAGSQKRRRILTQTSIDRYYQRGLITAAQYNTAIYVYALYRKSEKRITSSYNPDAALMTSNIDDKNMAGFCDYMDIVKVLPSKLFNIVQHIVIYGFSANEFDKQYDNKRKTLNELRLALDMLSDHFGVY
jgi:hypothetical protein